jgi:predicted transcriptional regulator
MASDNSDSVLNGPANSTLRRLLGSLELQVMDVMWQTEQATVRQMTETIGRKQQVAYTTVMTVMVHLVDKGLLQRIKEGKRYRYRVTRSRSEFLRDSAKSELQALVSDFGDIAIAQFLEEIEKIDGNRLQRLRNLVREAAGGTNTPE